MDSWINCLEECLPEFGITLDQEKTEQLAKILKENASCIYDMEYDRLGGRSITPEKDYKKLYEQAQREIAELSHANDVYRKSVAERRRVDVSDVRIENDSVVY